MQVRHRLPLAEWINRSAVGERPYRLVARQNGRLLVLDSRIVTWIGAEGDYVRFHHGKQSVLVRRTMAAVERELASARFLRIHRSAIVNLDFIVEARPVPGGDHRVFLKDGTVLTLSRCFRRRACAGIQNLRSSAFICG